MRRARQTLIHLQDRRFWAVLLVVAYLSTIVGVRWPTEAAAPDAKPYPCQGHQCGCRSAEQCWSHCCCFTPEQRLAWARANQIEPPDELTAVLAADDHDSPADCTAHSCCHKSAAHAAHHVADHSAAQSQAKPIRGDGFKPAKCHGINTLWVVSGAVAPPAPPVQWCFDWTISGVLPTLDCSPTAVPVRPAIPPPRSLARLWSLATV